MAANLSPEDLAKLKAAFDRGERVIELNGKLYQPEFTGGTYSSPESGGQNSEGTLSGWMAVTPGQAKSSRMIDAYDASGAFTGQRRDSYTNPLADVAKFGAAAYGLNALGGAMTSAMGGTTAGLSGAAPTTAGEAATTTFGNANTLGAVNPYGISGGALESAAADALATGGFDAGTLGASTGSIAGGNAFSALGDVGVSGGLMSVPSLTSAAGNAATAAGTAAGSKAAAPTNGWDILDKVGTAALTTAAAGAVSNALAPDTDTSRINALIDGMITDQGIARDRSKSMWDDYLATWKPIEQRFAQTALNYDTPERRQQAANEASGQVASQYDTARTSAERQAIAAGVDPSTIATLGLNSRILEAKDRAGAENQARTGVETRGLSLLQGAANFGRNMPNTSLQQAGQANNTANAAVSAQNSANATEANATNTRNAIFGDILGAGAQLYGMNNKGGGSLWSHIPGLSSLFGGGG